MSRISRSIRSGRLVSMSSNSQQVARGGGSQSSFVRRSRSSCVGLITDCRRVFGSVVGKGVNLLKLRIFQRHWHDHRDALADFGVRNHFHCLGVEVSEDVPLFEVLRECAFKLETRVSDEMAESYDFDSHVCSFLFSKTKA